jgi:hypothetical protein
LSRATNALNDARNETYFMPHVSIGRIVGGEGTRSRPGITGDRPEAVTDWLSDDPSFDRVALSDQPDHLEQLGVAVPSDQQPSGSPA